MDSKGSLTGAEKWRPSLGGHPACFRGGGLRFQVGRQCCGVTHAIYTIYVVWPYCCICTYGGDAKAHTSLVVVLHRELERVDVMTVG